MSTRRKGKVAGLAHAVRTAINLALRDGATYADAARLAPADAGITEKNIENWAKADPTTGTSGYLDWLAEQDRLADMQAKREFALEVVRQNEGSTIHEASLQLAASQLYEVVSEFDLDGLKADLRDSPKNYGLVVDALTKLSKGGLEFAKYRDRVAEQKRRIEAELGKAKAPGGLTPDTIERIERELKLL